MGRIRKLGKRRWAAARTAMGSTDFAAFADLGSEANRRLLLLLFSGLAVSTGVLGTVAMLPYSDRLDLPVATTALVGAGVVFLGVLALALPATTPMLLLDVIVVAAVGVVSAAASQSPVPVAGYTVLFYVWPMIVLVMLRSKRATLVHFAVIAGCSGLLFGLDDTFRSWPVWWGTMLLSLANVWQSTGWLVRRGRDLAVRQRKARDRAEEVRSALERVSEQKSRFLAAMSHELRTPLNAVIGFAELLQRRVAGPLNPKQAEYVDDIVDSGRHLLSLINDTLDTAKVEAGGHQLERAEVPLAELIDDAVRLVRQPAAEGGITFEGPTGHLGSAVIDGRRIKQVLVNLLSNAVKFSPDGGRIRLLVSSDGDHVEVAVHDEGPGIHPDHHESIFEEFSQTTADPGDRRAGAGLGLAVSRRIVELHGGHIGVESNPGRGARFWFTIPRDPAPMVTLAGTAAEPTHGASDDPAIALTAAEVYSRGFVFAAYVGLGAGGVLLVDPDGVSAPYLWTAVVLAVAIMVGAKLAVRRMTEERLWAVGRLTNLGAEVFTVLGVYYLGPFAPIAVVVWVGQTFFVRFLALGASPKVHWLRWAGAGVALAVVLAIQRGNDAPLAQWLAAMGTLWIASFLVGWLLQRFQVLARAERAAAADAIQVATELAEVSRHRSEFMAGMSHELRTPLNAIIGFAQVLERNMAGPLNARQREYLGDIVTSGRHLLDLISDILDMARMDAGRFEVSLEPIRLTEVVEDALQSAGDAVAAKRLRVGTDVPDLLEVSADRARLVQALHALVSNAVKFTPVGGAISIRAHQTAEDTRLEVADSGPGVSPGGFDDIFEPFHQHSLGPDRALEGAGLGLALAQRLVALHGGTIEVESRLGAGATFTIVLPHEPSLVGLQRESPDISPPPSARAAGITEGRQ